MLGLLKAAATGNAVAKGEAMTASTASSVRDSEAGDGAGNGHARGTDGEKEVPAMLARRPHEMDNSKLQVTAK